MRNLLRVLTAIALALGTWAWGPAQARACACGAFIANDAAIGGETAVVRYFDGVETIDMSMQVVGEASDAAWIMPVPRGTEVSLGKADFEMLRKATQPEIKTVENWWPNPGALPGLFLPGAREDAAPVEVVSVAEVGPFEVTTLTGSGPAAVGDWLVQHGYTRRDDLSATFSAYLERGYQILAVKLLPGDAMLSGDLAPLRMTFATQEVTYPILLSRHAEEFQAVRLYLVAEHKMAVAQEASPSTPLRMRFAGPLEMSIIEPETSGSVFVTLYTTRLNPDDIQADYTFAQASDDEPFREVTIEVVEMGHFTLLAILMLALALIMALVIYRRLARG